MSYVKAGLACWMLMAGLVACDEGATDIGREVDATADTTPDESKSGAEDSDTDASTPDAGTTTPDSGTTKPDAGTTTPDSGSTTPDAGSSYPDSGTTTPDAGSSYPDSGTTKPDAGTSYPDSGTTKPDSGTSTPDSGTSTPDSGTSYPDSGTSTPDSGTSYPDSGTSTPDSGTSTPDSGTSYPDSGSSEPDSGSSTPDAGPGPSDPAEAVCGRWNADRANLSEGSWSGSEASCNAGDISATGRGNALKIVNLYRFLAGMPEVQTDPTRNSAAQQCALMMEANNSITHTPPTSWKCYSQTGAQAAGKSNIATVAGVYAVDMYMIDPGNATTLGHRRWLLSNSLGPIGLGSTSGYSCMWVLSGSGKAGEPWVAWPPPGVFPYEANALGWSSMDKTGWSFQSDSINLTGAKVTIRAGGQTLPIKVTQLASNYGSKYALSMIPQGWTMEAGQVYDVTVATSTQTINYQVDVVDCGDF